MKSTELMIGNWLTNGTVVGLTDSIITVYDGYQNWTSDKVEMSPILITKAWLAAHGFDKDDLGDEPPYEQWFNIKIPEFVIWDFNGEHWILDMADQAGCNNDLKYVHQLQNMFFISTGERL